MGTTAYAGESAFRRVPTGVHVARCVGVIDLGTQSVEYQGVVKDQHKLQIRWEILGEDEQGVPLTTEVDGKEMPLTISKRYTLSLHDKASMRRDLEAWRGKPFDAAELKGFDVAKLLGAYCMLNVVEQEGGNGKTYSNINGITPLPRELAKHKPAGVHPLVSFDVDNPDMKLFETFHDKLQATISECAEWRSREKAHEAKNPPKRTVDPSIDPELDDVPF